MNPTVQTLKTFSREHVRSYFDGCARTGSGAYIVKALAFCQVLFLVACSSWEVESGEKLEYGYRLTQGAGEDGQFSFHPRQRKAVFVRQLEESKASKSTPYQREIWEVLLDDPDEPRMKEVVPLRGAFYPSYAGDRGIVALNERSTLVHLKTGEDFTSRIPLEGLAGTPSRPKADPTGKWVVFFALTFDPEHPARDDLRNYQLFLVPIEGGRVRQLTTFDEPGKVIEQAYWRTEDTLHVVYRLDDARGRTMYRVERLNVHTGDQRLALFTDFHYKVYLSPSERFFVTGGDEFNQLSFYSRNTKIAKNFKLQGMLSEASITPDEKWVLTAHLFQSDGAVSLHYLPVPEVIDRLAAVPE